MTREVVVISAYIPTIKNVPVKNKSESLFYNEVIKLCNKNDIKLTYDNNLIGSATGIGDILLKFASMKFKTDRDPFYFNLYYFTRPYYSMNPINQLEFRIKLIRELCECNDIPTDMVRFIYSKNPNINACTTEMYQRMNDFNLNLKLISSRAIDGEYIVFHTKCRHRKNENYGLLQQKINAFCSNYKSGYKIVILGERKFPHTEEVDMHGITQIYNELLNLKKNNQVIDLSIDCIYSNLNYESYKNDLQIIQLAKHNISFGVGGSLCNSLCFGKSTIIYCKSEIIQFNVHKLIEKNVHHFNPVEDCFNYIIKITSDSLPFKLSMINCLNKQIISPIENCTMSDAEKQFIESASKHKSNDVVFCSHMGLGDVLLNVGIINLLLNFYKTVHYFCKKEYVCNVSTMFANKPVRLVPIDKFENQSIISNMKRYNFNTTDCILAGIINQIHPALKSIVKNEYLNEYKRRFGTNANPKTLYKHVGCIHSDVGVKWDVCLKYYDVHIPPESMMYYQTIKQYTIMFMHEIASTASTVDFSKIINRYINLPNHIIICANRNAYSVKHPLHNVVQSFVNLPFMFYYDTLLNATYIHVVDSSFSCIPFILKHMNAISPKTFMVYARDKPYDAIIAPSGQVIIS